MATVLREIETELPELRPALRRHGLSLGVATFEEPGLRPAGPGELRLTGRMSAARRREFLAGRQAMRRALAGAGFPAREILYDGRRPRLPAGCAGSLSHSEGVAVALAGRRERLRAVGVDLEFCRLPLAAAHLVLSPEENRVLTESTVPEAEAAQWLRAVFSAKESALKAFTALLPPESAPRTLRGIAVRPAPGGFRAWPCGLPRLRLHVTVERMSRGVLTWAVPV
jgi:enterobactin synthetase component D